MQGRPSDRSIVQVMRFMYAAGGMIAPLIVTPYVTPQSDAAVSSGSVSLAIPFWIIAGICAAAALIFALAWLLTVCDTRSTQQSLSTGITDAAPITRQYGTCSTETGEQANRELPVFWKTAVICLVIIFVHMGTGLLYTVSNLLDAYARSFSPSYFTPVTAAYLMTLYYAMITLSCLVSSLAAYYRITDSCILCWCIASSLTGSLLFCISTPSHPSVIWIAVSLLALGLASMQASVTTLLREYVLITDCISSLMTFFAILSSLIYSVAVASAMEQTPKVMDWFLMTTSSCAALVFVIMQFLFHFKLKPYKL